MYNIDKLEYLVNNMFENYLNKLMVKNTR